MQAWLLESATLAEYARQLADMLDEAPRVGTAVDKPEGMRRVEFSDELLRVIARHLRQLVAREG
jgi:hypothetical protein